MKKLIGIILAICVLSTMAFAATPGISDQNVDQDAYTVSFKYSNIAADGQATMLAYEVTSLFDEDAEITDETEVPDYQGEETTPIKGIDQEGVDANGFSFKVAEGYEGIIAVKIGGTGIDAPAEFLVVFKKEVVTPPEGGGEGGEDPENPGEGGGEGGEDPDPDQPGTGGGEGGEDPDPDQPGTGGGEGGEDPDPDQPGTGGGEGGEDPDPDQPGTGGGETVLITIKWGDVNGDGSVDGTDVTLVKGATIGYGVGTASGYDIGQVIGSIDSVSIKWGDVNGDGSVDGTDVTLIKGATIGYGVGTASGYDIGEIVVGITPAK